MPAPTNKPGRGATAGEFALLARVRASVPAGGRGVVVGIGDDCAVVEGPRRGARLVLTTDTMVEGIHFDPAWLTARELGVRAWRAAVSDVASMGARPLYALLSLELVPGDFAGRDAPALVRAVATEAARAGASLVGGNVSAARQRAVTVTVVGEARARPLLRSTARAGDLVFVTGALGGAAAGWRALAAAAAGRRPAAMEAARRTASAWLRPAPRLEFAAALAEAGLAHAAVDISDGLLQDLGHVARESAVAIRVEAGAVPVHRLARAAQAAAAPRAVDAAGATPRPARAARAARADRGAHAPGEAALPAPLQLALSGGEDYELAFTASPRRRAAIEALARATRTPIHAIGAVEAGRPRVMDADGRAFALAASGFDHGHQARRR